MRVAITFLILVCPLFAFSKGCDSEYQNRYALILGKPMQFEIFSPKSEGRYPAVIMIHGSAGLYHHSGTQIPTDDNFGEHQLACNGIIAILVHYFDSTAINSTFDRDLMRQSAPTWLQGLRSALNWIMQLKEVDSKNVALLGESLGGYLSVALGVTDSRIRVVSAFSSGNPKRLITEVTNHPDVLLYHGANDSLITLTEARETRDWLMESKIPCTLRVFEDVSHGLDAPSRDQILLDLTNYLRSR
jgi:dienelactone hydrolase